MSLLSWLGLRREKIRKTGGSPRRRRSLRVEQLEDRSVPASYSATTVPELIAAIDAANLTPEADTISLAPATTFTLTQPNNTTHGTTGLPVIAAGSDVTIFGNGSIIERSSASGTPAFRLFDGAAGAALRLENLTLQGGLAFGSGASASGGAIYSQGTLALTQVVVQNNQALGQRGAHATYTISHGGDANVNPATDGASAFGGGIYIGGGSALLSGVTLTSNIAQGGRGGDGLSVHVGGGNSRIDSGRITEPSADGGHGLGGGLYAAGGSVTFVNSAVTNNSALGGAAGKGKGGVAGQGIGGGLYIEADVLALLDAFTASNVKRSKASTSDPNIHGPYSVG